MNVARLSIRYPLYPWLLALTCLAGGIWGIDVVGRLEDPPFPVRHAYVITPYPGASAEMVEEEVTDPIEAALQELPYLKSVQSKSVPGRSEVHVEVSVDDQLRLVVRDDGVGLPANASSSGGRGLRNMRARVAELGGTMQLAPTEPSGTELRWTAPLR